jgi:hypothetical protein
MIDSVKQIKTMRAIDLPDTFDIRVGAFEYPFEIVDWDLDYVYAKSIKDNQIVNIPIHEEVTVLVPDTWENAAVDIEFDLMKEGSSLMESTYTKRQKIAGSIVGLIMVAISCYAVLDAIYAVTH